MQYVRTGSLLQSRSSSYPGRLPLASDLAGRPGDGLHLFFLLPRWSWRAKLRRRFLLETLLFRVRHRLRLAGNERLGNDRCLRKLLRIKTFDTVNLDVGGRSEERREGNVARTVRSAH